MPKNLKLKAARAEKDLTQSALAEAAGVPPDHQRHRKGRVQPHHQPLPQHLQDPGQNTGRIILGGINDEIFTVQQEKSV